MTDTNLPVTKGSEVIIDGVTYVIDEIHLDVCRLIAPDRQVMRISTQVVLWNVVQQTTIHSTSEGPLAAASEHERWMEAWALLDNATRAAYATEYAHLQEVRTGFPTGEATEKYALPRAEYDPALSMESRLRAKVAELGDNAKHTVTIRRRAKLLDDFDHPAALMDPRYLRSVELVDERLMQVAEQVINRFRNASDVPKKVRAHKVRRAFAKAYPDEELPCSDRALDRLVTDLSRQHHLDLTASQREQRNARPKGPYRKARINYSGQYVELDDQTLDLAIIDSTGNRARPHLLTAIDAYDTRLVAFRVLIGAPTSTDVRMLMFDAISGTSWGSTTSGVDDDEREPDDPWRTVATLPPLAVQSFRVDRGTNFVADDIQESLRILGISLTPAPPHSPAKKPHVESCFNSLKTMLAYLDGFTGGSVASRGSVEAVEGRAHLNIEDLEVVIASFAQLYNQTQRPPRDAKRGDKGHSPIELHAMSVYQRGCIDLLYPPSLMYELLDHRRAQVTDNGITWSKYSYDCVELDPYRNVRDHRTGNSVRLEVRRHDHDLSRVYVYLPREQLWQEVPTKQVLNYQPFSDLVPFDMQSGPSNLSLTKSQSARARDHLAGQLDDWLVERLAERIGKENQAREEDRRRRVSNDQMRLDPAPRPATVDDDDDDDNVDEVYR